MIPVWLWWVLFNIPACLRGLYPRWPSAWRGWNVSCGLKSWREAHAMFQHGWIPWTVQRTPYGTARTFKTQGVDEDEQDGMEPAQGRRDDREHHQRKAVRAN
jgi:hypothetical protein